MAFQKMRKPIPRFADIKRARRVGLEIIRDETQKPRPLPAPLGSPRNHLPWLRPVARSKLRHRSPGAPSPRAAHPSRQNPDTAPRARCSAPGTAWRRPSSGADPRARVPRPRGSVITQRSHCCSSRRPGGCSALGLLGSGTGFERMDMSVPGLRIHGRLDEPGPRRLGLEHFEIRDVGIPLDQRRKRGQSA